MEFQKIVKNQERGNNHGSKTLSGFEKKIAVKKEATGRAHAQEPKKIVLVGTYTGAQLEKWLGYYPYPLYDDDKIDVEAAKKIRAFALYTTLQMPLFSISPYARHRYM